MLHNSSSSSYSTTALSVWPWLCLVLLKIVPPGLILTFLIIFSIHTLNKRVDNESPCRSPIVVSKLGDSFPWIFTLLFVFAKVILTNLYQLHWYSRLFHYFHQLGLIYGIICLFIINIQLMYIYLIFTCFLQDHSQTKNLVSSRSTFLENRTGSLLIFHQHMVLYIWSINFLRSYKFHSGVIFLNSYDTLACHLVYISDILWLCPTLGASVFHIVLIN